MTTLRDLEGTRWTGKGELWLDPLGNQADVSDCAMEVVGDGVRYRWSHEGKAHEGRVTLREGGAEFTDTFHSPTVTPFEVIAGSRALLDVLGSYSMDGGPAWGWRITLALRPSGELVLTMTNITPWGEEGRAVRMTGVKA